MSGKSCLHSLPHKDETRTIPPVAKSPGLVPTRYLRVWSFLVVPYLLTRGSHHEVQHQTPLRHRPKRHVHPLRLLWRAQDNHSYPQILEGTLKHE